MYDDDFLSPAASDGRGVIHRAIAELPEALDAALVAEEVAAAAVETDVALQAKAQAER